MLGIEKLKDTKANVVVANLIVKDDIHFISRLVPFLLTCSTESIECFIEDRRMIRLLAHPPSLTLPEASCLSFSVFLGVAGQALGGGVGR
jgi:hypothetical protein